MRPARPHAPAGTFLAALLLAVAAVPARGGFTVLSGTPAVDSSAPLDAATWLTGASGVEWVPLGDTKVWLGALAHCRRAGRQRLAGVSAGRRQQPRARRAVTQRRAHRHTRARAAALALPLTRIRCPCALRPTPPTLSHPAPLRPAPPRPIHHHPAPPAHPQGDVLGFYTCAAPTGAGCAGTRARAWYSIGLGTLSASDPFNSAASGYAPFTSAATNQFNGEGDCQRWVLGAGRRGAALGLSCPALRPG
jgi:hypothetical protein